MTAVFGLAARAYLDAGWSPIPLMPRDKFPPADGYTGVNGKYVDELTLKRWAKSGANVSAGKLSWIVAQGNIALRLPPRVLGIDVDMYEGKAGRATFKKAKETWGPLPPTWYTSARTDGSGIRLYRVPEGLAWPGKLPTGGGVELIRWDHRYAVVGPSTHPDTGAPYRWFVEDPSLTSGAVTGGIADPWGVVAEDEFPDVDDLPELPEAWVKALTSGKRWEDRPALEMDEGEVHEWLKARNGPKICKTMQATLNLYCRRLRAASDDGGTHDVGRDGAWALIGDAHAGHAGIVAALRKLKSVFVPAVGRRADKRMAEGEWARFVIRGVQKVAAEGEADEEDICALISSSTTKPVKLESGDGSGEAESSGGTGSGGSAHLTFVRSDTGNAERLARAYRHEQKYVKGVGWFVWSYEERRWKPDQDGAVLRRAIEVVRKISDEAEFLAQEDPKQYGEVKKFAVKSESKGSLDSMIGIAAGLNGMTLPLSAFDADPARLGRIVLKPNPGVEVTPALPEHRVTLGLGCDYDPEALSPLWNSFLERFQPDPEIRLWLQKLVGYSLYGANPDRLFVVCFGPSSTGKTTFAEALRAALGDYAAVVNMTVFRDNQDDRPRPDLIRALRKRFVYAEEASSSWHLHPDQVKRLTGGAPVVARGMRSDAFHEIAPAFTPWLITNAPPTIEGADIALRRRLVMVPWNVVVPQEAEDSSYRARLMDPEVRPAVLAWALAGWTLYAGDRDLSAPASALATREEFLSELSDFDRAINEIAVIGEHDGKDFELPATLYSAYKMWATNAGVKPESNTKFGAYLSGRGILKIKKRVDGTPTWVRLGVRLAAEYGRLVT